MSPRFVMSVVGVFLAFAAFLTVAPAWVDDRTVALVDDVVFIAFTVTGAVASARTARATDGRLRAGWTAMTIAMVCWAAGDVIWTFYELRGRDPFPSAADVPYLAFPLAATVALLLFPKNRRQQSSARTVLDGAIVAGSLFIISWMTGLAAVYRDAALSTAELVVSLAYPLGAVILLTVASVTVVRSDPRRRLPMTLLAAGLACSALASGFFAYIDPVAGYASGHLLDLGWALGAVMVILAAVADRASRQPSAQDASVSWSSAWMTYIPLMAAVVVIAVVGDGRVVGAPVSVVSVILVGTVLARQLLTDLENRRLMRAVSDQALHDPLTGLANRAYYQREMKRLRDRGVPVAVLALDLNDFKAVNDTYGHAAGDDLLVEVAQRIQRCVRSRDTVVRLGGDEFVILLEGRHDYARDVAARLAAEFAVPVTVAGVGIDVRYGLGIAAADDGAAGEDLLGIADMAMYDTKRSRRSAATDPPAPTAARSS